MGRRKPHCPRPPEIGRCRPAPNSGTRESGASWGTTRVEARRGKRATESSRTGRAVVRDAGGVVGLAVQDSSAGHVKSMRGMRAAPVPAGACLVFFFLNFIYLFFFDSDMKLQIWKNNKRFLNAHDNLMVAKNQIGGRRRTPLKFRFGYRESHWNFWRIIQIYEKPLQINTIWSVTTLYLTILHLMKKTNLEKLIYCRRIRDGLKYLLNVSWKPSGSNF